MKNTKRLRLNGQKISQEYWVLKACKMYARNVQDTYMNTTSEICCRIESIKSNADELVEAV